MSFRSVSRTYPTCVEKTQLWCRAGAPVETDFWVHQGQIPQAWMRLAHLAHACVSYEWPMKRVREGESERIGEASKTSSLQPNTHTCVFLRVSISHPRTQHWDSWPISEAGLWKSRNLGIGFWQWACWHGDKILQLPWTLLTDGRKKSFWQN